MSIFVTMIAAASLIVPKVDLGTTPAMERVDSLMETAGLPLHTVDKVNWPDEFPDRPEVKFRIAHSGDEIYIKFYVTEQTLRAVYDADGGRPWEESCVEFFLSPGEAGDPVYYNLEMSCAGFGILHARNTLTGEGGAMPGLANVRRLTSLPREPFGVRQGEAPYSWTLTLAIPVEVYSTSPVPPLSGRTLRGNFYKCGDLLPRPHFLSWSPIDTPKPSFHQPGFFGELFFE
jgi:hypothetical protein